MKKQKLSKEDFENVKTIGELKKLLEIFLKEIRSKDAKSALTKAIVSEVPFLGTAKNVKDIMKRLAVKRPDNERPDNALGILDVDDELEKIISPKVLERFLDFLVISINDDDSTPISDWNINIELESYLKELYKGRTITGFNKKRIKTTESVLRDYIKNYLI
tara:strand:- start:169 stop:654 length:486 start_codon:yes stop_codon:yes gene_type:complete